MGDVTIFSPVYASDLKGDRVPWETSDQLWEHFQEYRRRCHQHPFVNRVLKAKTGYDAAGQPTEHYVMVPVDTVRIQAPTLEGFMEYSELTTKSWEMAKERPALDFAIRRVEEAIANLTYQLAAAGMINANLAARKLELAENIDVKSTTDRTTLDPKKLSSSTLEEILLAQDESLLDGDDIVDVEYAETAKTDD